MSKLTRYAQKLFGSTAASNQIAKFGSLAAGSAARYSGTTITPDLVQALGNYLQGWKGAVVGSNSPAIEDMNALCYLFAYQLSYLFQEGISEWEATTTYYIGSLVNDGNGNVYVSIQNTNLNHAVSSNTWWYPVTSLVNSGFVSGLVAPTLAANQSITLPVLPASQAVLQMSSAGVMTALPRAVTTNGTNPGLGGLVMSSSINYSSSSGSSAVTNSSVTLTTGGRPVMLMLIPDPTQSNPIYIAPGTSGASGTTLVAGLQMAISSTPLGQGVSWNFSVSSGSITLNPCFSQIDYTSGAGTRTYNLLLTTNGSPHQLQYGKLMAYEL